LSHNETSTAKIDHKNEISVKDWVGSTWVAKSQLWKKSTLLVKVNAKSQRMSAESQRWSTEKSTVNASQSQRLKSTVNAVKVN
jgi:hypothetical protein